MGRGKGIQRRCGSRASETIGRWRSTNLYGNGNMSYGNRNMSYGNGNMSYGNENEIYRNGNMSYGDVIILYCNR